MQESIEDKSRWVTINYDNYFCYFGMKFNVESDVKRSTYMFFVMNCFAEYWYLTHTVMFRTDHALLPKILMSHVEYRNIRSIAINCNKFDILNNLLLWQYPTEYCLSFSQYRLADHRSAKYSNRVARKWVGKNLVKLPICTHSWKFSNLQVSSTDLNEGEIKLSIKESIWTNLKFKK